MSMEVNTIPGFYFTPTDEDLISFYLKPKVMEQPLPWDGILEKNLYEDDPWVILPENDPWKIVRKAAKFSNSIAKKEIYIFTKLTKRGVLIVRGAGRGSWAGNKMNKDVKNRQGEKIGIKKYFNFKIQETLKKDMEDVHWHMQEYTLAGMKSTDYALCRIMRDFPNCNKTQETLTSMAMAVNTIPGFYFTPTDEDLISFYLKPKATERALPWDGILEKNIYGPNATPWEELTENDPWEIVRSTYEDYTAKKEIYVFTKLKKSVEGDTVVWQSRVAGCGTWAWYSYYSMEIKNCYGQKIGTKKLFAFQVKGLGKAKMEMEKGRWTMHEYTLAGISLGDEEIKHSDYAICRVIRDLSKFSKDVGDGESSKRKQGL